MFRRRQQPSKPEFHPLPAEHSAKVKPVNPIRQIWRDFTSSDEKDERRNRLIATANRLEKLKDADGWGDLMELKMWFQANASQIATTPSRPENQRFAAAVQWSIYEEFFSEISRIIRRGKEAEASLEEKKDG